MHRFCAANCALRSVSKENLDHIKKKHKDGKIHVSAEVAAVWTLPGVPLANGAELLLDYGGKAFWAPTFVASEYCAVCFSRDATDPQNPLVQCEGQLLDGSECTVSRHRHCFRPSNKPSLEELTDNSVSYYCPDHYAQCAAPDATPKSRRASIRMHTQCTPPPSVHPASASAASVSVASNDAASVAMSAAGAIANAESAAARPSHSGTVDAVPAPAPPRVMFQLDVTPPPKLLMPSSPPPRSTPSVARSIVFQSAPLRPSAAAAAAAAVTPRAPAAAASAAMSSPPSMSTASQIDYFTVSDGEWDSDGWQHDEQSCEDGSDGESEVAAFSTALDDDAVPLGGASASCSQSIALSQLELNEAEALGARVLQARSGNPLLRMKIRSPEQAEQLENWKSNLSTIAAGQLLKLEQAFALYAAPKHGYSRRAFWFIPKTAQSNPVVDDASSAQSIAKSSTSVASAPAAIQGITNKSVASQADAAAAPNSRVTVQRWRSFQSRGDGSPVTLERDWAEYRSCCASSMKQPHWPSMTQEAAKKHSAHSIVHMFAARLDFYARFDTREQFKAAVRVLLLEQLNNQVPWSGGHVCLSCFRAILGKGRTWMFATRKSLDEDVLHKFPKLTEHGRLRQSRPALGRDRAVTLLRAWGALVGHHAPNPKNRSLAITTLFLPVKDMEELAHRLSEFEMAEQKLSQLTAVKKHTLRAARNWLYEQENLQYKIGSSIQLMRCAVCDELDNRVKTTYIAAFKRTAQEVLEDKYAKQCHLATMQKQRNFFTKQKDLAMSNPEELWTLTIDGMDQSKTQLPHRARFNKDLEPLARMKVHAEGGFCFGGPQPVLGLLNFPDVRKDSNLCVLTVERILDIQFGLLEKQCQKQRDAKVAAAAVAAAAAAALNDREVDQQMLDAQRAARTVGADGLYPEDGVGMKWPKRLHITFDNAASECKNQWMFRFLGLLVLHGVFLQITVSTLLVGHTHDIVDQLFSIWARMLRIHDAETYEKMRNIFRERYITRIQGLIDLMKKRRTEAAAAGLSSPRTREEEAFAEVMESSSESSHWSSEAAEILSNFSSFVRDTFKDPELCPHIELQSVCIEVQGWLKRAVVGKLPDLKNLDQAHNFGIEKDEQTGDVYLYNKHLCDSTSLPDTGSLRQVKHHYLGRQTGDYTTRALLYRTADRQEADPYKIPPLVVHTAKLRETAAKYAAASAMTAAELHQFYAMLQRMDDAHKVQREVCQVCAELSASYSGHGVIHRPKGADDVDLQAARKKSSAKDKAWQELMAHLYDPQYADVHNARQVHTGWWTKWLHRADEHIVPAFITRGLVLNPKARVRRFHQHPANLVSGTGEQPVVLDLGRVDVSWLHKYGIPRPGQMAVVRSDDAMEPFRVVEIVAVRGLDEAARAEIARVEAEEAALSAEHKQAEAVNAAGIAAAAAAGPAAATATAPAAAAAAIPLTRKKRIARRETQELRFSLKSLEVTVIWWDLATEDFKNKMHFVVPTFSAALKKKTQSGGKSGAPRWARPSKS